MHGTPSCACGFELHSSVMQAAYLLPKNTSQRNVDTIVEIEHKYIASTK